MMATDGLYGTRIARYCWLVAAMIAIVSLCLGFCLSLWYMVLVPPANFLYLYRYMYV